MLPSRKSFYEYLSSFASASPKQRILGDQDGWLTAGKVLMLAETLACKFQRDGIQPGDYIALHTERNVRGALALLGLRLAGAVAVLIDPREDIQKVLNSCDPPKNFVPDECTGSLSGSVIFL